MRERFIGGRAGTIVAFVGIAVVVMVAAILAGEPDTRRSGPPLDPRSTTDSGTRAAVLLMERHGRDVSIGAVTTRADTFIVLEDTLSDRDRAALLAEVERGASLVIADATSSMVERRNRSSTVESGSNCDLEGLDEVEDLGLGLVPSLFPGDIASCFPAGDGWLLTVSDRGSGRVVAISSARPFTNDRLAERDHAALVIGVIDLTAGPIRLVHAAPGSGDRTLADLIGQPVWAGLAVGLVAVVAFGAHRARRLGAPVVERDAVEIDGSELVTATARLYARARSGGHVLGAMSENLKRDLASRWSFDPKDDVESMVQRLQLTAEEAEHLRVALTPGNPETEAEFAGSVAHAVMARQIVHGTLRRTGERT